MRPKRACACRWFPTVGYDSLAALQLLAGVIDIYMPDMKYADARLALKLCKARNYPEVNRWAFKEMRRQVGGLVMDGRGLTYGALKAIFNQFHRGRETSVTTRQSL